MQVRTHSYSKEMAGVVEIKFVIGGRSLRTRRGSTGVKVANCGIGAMSLIFSFVSKRRLTSFTILISIQLLLLVVSNSNSCGASGKKFLGFDFLDISVMTLTVADTTPMGMHGLIWPLAGVHFNLQHR